MDGTVADGFEPVREAFAENFRRNDEIGAACAVYRDGETVVDLWGGYRDTEGTVPWERDTQVLVFSTSKGLAAAALLLARSRGAFDLDDRVSQHWPEFGQFGKYEVTIRELLAHRAGLVTLDETLQPEDVADREHLADVLARQEPDWEPGTRHGYHALTLGWYQSELLRRTDGRPLEEYFAEEVAEPLDLTFRLGASADVPVERVAQLSDYNPMRLLSHAHEVPMGLVGAYLTPRSLTRRAFQAVDISRPGDLNSPEWRAVSIPSANGIGEVRSIAKLYGELATGAEELGIDDATLAEATTKPEPPSGGDRDLVLKVPMSYAAGFTKPHGDVRFGRSTSAFGAPGAGGSFGFADPDAGVGFAYAPNRMGFRVKDDPREVALRDAVYECLD